MRYMSGDEIRKTWLNFFQGKGHKIEASASLIPHDDPTLLWINAGISPLKKFFDGSQVPPAKRLANIQKCIRTNDIENVGKTARHHTFFEMLGNFSIGDYFKVEAINFAFELLTSKNYYALPVERLYITYSPIDLETKKAWLDLGIKETHLIAVEDNYWEIGEGPSGPNTEIFYDRGSSYDPRGIILIEEDLDNERYIELWNIVFSQYNAKKGVPRSEYEELPSKNIDTGAGLERFACILQNVETNFETDQFFPIIKKLEKISQIPYQGQSSYKIIADHVKTLVMAISDGAVLSNEGRGYVLRRLLRRALKHGRELGIEGPFLTQLTAEVVKIMGGWYENVKTNITFVNQVIQAEELKFLETLAVGEALISKIVREKKTLTKQDSFLLFDTYGFPLELQEEYANEHQIKIDKEGFYELLEAQKELSRKSRKEAVSMAIQDEAYLKFKEKSLFVGYQTLTTTSKVIKVFPEGVVFDKTPFYATSGGQVADQGTADGYPVLDVIALPNGQNLHLIEQEFKIGQMVELIVDANNRQNIMKNHTATHLLHKALKDVLGKHVNQQGSYVSAELLRFDFNHYQNLTATEILTIENKVKAQIAKQLAVETFFTTYEKAINLGAVALFGEKYGAEVRVVNINNESLELCGGTHVKNTKEINSFLISSVSSIGSGIFRIEAFTGEKSLKNFKKRNQGIYEEINSLFKKRDLLIAELKHLDYNKEVKVLITPELKGSYQDVLHLHSFVDQLSRDNKVLERELTQLKEKELLAKKADLLKEKRNNLILTKDLESNTLRGLLFELYDKIKSDTLLILNTKDEKITYLVKTNQKNAKQIIKRLNEISGGSGGGRDDFATGGTSNYKKLSELIKVMETI